MHPDEAFDVFQKEVDADASHVRKARRRRDIFRDAFEKLGDVKQVIPSGSLARGTQLDPIHDVDLIVVFDADAHQDWGSGGESAEAALKYTQQQVCRLLGNETSILKCVVGETLLRNHVVKCFLDPRFLAEDPDFKSFFAVEVMPALRSADALLVPERKKDRWQTTDPEWLIAEVHRRQERWEYFIRTVRIVKYWTQREKAGIKPLAAEVLTLRCLPDVRTSEMSRSVALLRFFTAASSVVMSAISDPTGHCGEIQPDLRRARARELLSKARDIAAEAVAWEQQGEYHKAICCWRAIFGPDFPLPPGGCPGSGGGGGGLPGEGNGGDGGADLPGPKGSGGSDPRNGGSGPDRGDGGPDPSSSSGYGSSPGGSGNGLGDGVRPSDESDTSDGRTGAQRTGFPPPTSNPRKPVKDAPQG